MQAVASIICLIHAAFKNVNSGTAA
uniref:Uncharacterized protein n=1 Tax=Arundo donax TaxID=35708 RepID=A0A0A9HPG3_ARUDO